MHSIDREKLKDIFADAVGVPTSDRMLFIRNRCGGNLDLFNEVVSLLAANDATLNLIEENALDIPGKLTENSGDQTGKHFANYRIVREIGHGGMGTVFLAVRDDGEFEQQVALKIVRQSIADSQIIEHFRRERQILANLHHPNIAILLDGGVNEIGEPFIAMEYIDGKPLIEYATEKCLSVGEKLRLFVKVCGAIAYAHRNLVVHRDIKPSNILVTPDGEPKLLDFGLAKAFEGDSSATQTAVRAFTPAYASPEQIVGKTITTASDVYSLGVVFYELLTGAKPLQIENKNYEEIVQTINSSQPTPPSSVADRAGFERSNRLLKGDLDNIALMALRKEPERRYRTVEDFAGDIQHHLTGRPVAARPNTFGYRASKFIGRNKIAVAAAALISLSLLAGLIASLWQANVARLETARSDAVNRFLQNMLLTAIPESGVVGKKGAQASIVDVLDQAEKRLDGVELSSQAEVRSELRQLIGEAFLAQGMYDEAGRNLTRAMAERTLLFGANDPRTVKVECGLGTLALATGDYARAYEIFERRFPALQTEFENGRVEPEFYLSKLSDFAVTCRALNEVDQAEKLLRQTINVAMPLSIDSHANVARSILALILLDQGRFNEAKASQIATVQRLRETGQPDDPAIPAALTLLGSILMENGELRDAEADLTEGEAIYRKLYGPDFMATFDNVRLQSNVAYLGGDYSSAKKKIDTVLEAYRKNSNPKYISFATALTVKGLVSNKLGNAVEGENYLREALRLRNENLPPGHFMIALTQGSLGEVLLDEKKYTEAEPLLRDSLTSLRSSQKTENARLALAKTRIARLESAIAASSH